ncbi:MAG: HyaD/HybD family hydrogenase maturation endopeptidase [Heliobacteriaceae bacterium]|nr:HyaD/HybD family hydrogenase maturation endopeptidase [Heliobacteriaceae bacterium]
MESPGTYLRGFYLDQRSEAMTQADVVPAPIIVMGLGNYLYGDEGIGIHVVERLNNEGGLPAAVEIVDGATLGLNLLATVERAEKLLIIDCVQAGQPPGSIIWLENDAIPRYFAQKLSIHQLGFSEVLALAAWRESLPGEMVLLGLQPAELKWGIELSPAGTLALPKLVAACQRQVQQWLNHPTG